MADLAAYLEVARGVTFKMGDSSLIIQHLRLPHAKDLDPLGKIWAILRRRLKEEYGISAAGVFGYDDEQELISCTFFLDYAAVDNSKVAVGTYEETYRHFFPEMMGRFKDVILAFITAEEHGLAEYEDLFIGLPPSRRTFDAFFNKFLRSVRIRNGEDDRRASHQRDIMRQAISSNRAAADSRPPLYLIG